MCAKATVSADKTGQRLSSSDIDVNRYLRVGILNFARALARDGRISHLSALSLTVQVAGLTIASKKDSFQLDTVLNSIRLYYTNLRNGVNAARIFFQIPTKN